MTVGERRKDKISVEEIHSLISLFYYHGNQTKPFIRTTKEKIIETKAYLKAQGNSKWCLPNQALKVNLESRNTQFRTMILQTKDKNGVV